MAKVKLKLYSASLGVVAGKTFDVELADGASLGDFLQDVSRRLNFHNILLEKNGRIKRGFAILINGTGMYNLDGLDTVLKDGDEIAILSFITGG